MKTTSILASRPMRKTPRTLTITWKETAFWTFTAPIDSSDSASIDSSVCDPATSSWARAHRRAAE